MYSLERRHCSVYSDEGVQFTTAEVFNTAAVFNYRLYATEFINFLSTILVCRAKKMLVETSLNKTYSYKQILRFLDKAQKIRYTRNGSSSWKDNKRLKYIQSVIDVLGI